MSSQLIYVTLSESIKKITTLKKRRKKQCDGKKTPNIVRTKKKTKKKNKQGS